MGNTITNGYATPGKEARDGRRAVALPRDPKNDPLIGGIIGVVAAALFTLVRAALHFKGIQDAIPVFIYYLSAAALVGSRWGRTATIVTALAGLVFLHAFRMEVPRVRSLVGIPFYLFVTGFLAYLLQNALEARSRAEEHAETMRDERDQHREAADEAVTQYHLSQEASREQRRILQMLQRGTLVAAEPGIEGLSFAVAYEPARASALVGGDFYAVFALSPARLAVVLGDVTGKGVEAAASGVMVSNMLRAFFRESSSPAEVLRRLNAALSADPEFTLFTTLFAAVVDGRDCSVVYANAGQEPPCILGPEGELTRLETTGVTIGVLPDARYEECRLEVPPGCTLAAFTDGLTEIRLADKTWIQPDAAYERLAELCALPPEEIVRDMIVWARSVAPGGILRDDAALLAIRFEG